MVLNTGVEHYRMTQNTNSYAEHSLPHVISSSLEHDSIKLVLERYHATGRAGTYVFTENVVVSFVMFCVVNFT